MFCVILQKLQLLLCFPSPPFVTLCFGRLLRVSMCSVRFECVFDHLVGKLLAVSQ